MLAAQCSLSRGVPRRGVAGGPVGVPAGRCRKALSRGTQLQARASSTKASSVSAGHRGSGGGLEPLLTAIADLWRTADTRSRYPMLAEAVAALDAANPPPLADVAQGSPEAGRVPVLARLPEVGAQPRSGQAPVERVVEAFLAVAGALPWRQTKGYLDRLPRDFLDNYGYVQLVGPGQLFTESICPHDQVRVGILLWGPKVEYPLHHHPAEEMYHVLAGMPRIQVGAEAEHLPRPVGELLHLPPWTAHALQGGDTCTLVLYAWTGDVFTDATLL